MFLIKDFKDQMSANKYALHFSFFVSLQLHANQIDLHRSEGMEQREHTDTYTRSTAAWQAWRLSRITMSETAKWYRHCLKIVPHG